ncbi:hypothetical protein, partial [Desulfocicer niacini]
MKMLFKRTFLILMCCLLFVSCEKKNTNNDGVPKINNIQNNISKIEDRIIKINKRVDEVEQYLLDNEKKMILVLKVKNMANLRSSPILKDEYIIGRAYKNAYLRAEADEIDSKKSKWYRVNFFIDEKMINGFVSAKLVEKEYISIDIFRTIVNNNDLIDYFWEHELFAKIRKLDITRLGIAISDKVPNVFIDKLYNKLLNIKINVKDLNGFEKEMIIETCQKNGIQAILHLIHSDNEILLRLYDFKGFNVYRYTYENMHGNTFKKTSAKFVHEHDLKNSQSLVSSEESE